MLKKPPAELRIPKRLTLNRIVRKVNRRLRRHAIFVHNAIIREVLYEAFDCMTEHMLPERVTFLTLWAEHRFYVDGERRSLRWKNLRRRYGRDFFFGPDVQKQERLRERLREQQQREEQRQERHRQRLQKLDRPVARPVAHPAADVLPPPIVGADKCLTPDEMLAMYELREVCENRGDLHGAKAVDKALIYLRPQKYLRRR